MKILRCHSIEGNIDEGKYEKIPVSSVVDPDTDPHWYGTVARKLTKINKHPAFQKGFLYLRRYVLLTYFLHKIPVYLSFKNSVFLTTKFDQDPDPIRMDPYWFGCLDPDPFRLKSWIRMREPLDPDLRWNQCGSTTLLATNLKCY